MPSTPVTVAAVGLLAVSGGLLGVLLHEEHKRLSTESSEIAPWTYGEGAGDHEAPYAPEEWGDLYEDCYGDAQSPINLSPGYEEHADIMTFNLKFYPDDCYSNEMTFSAGDHSWLVDFSECEEPSRLSFNNDTYSLLQVHWHSVSEHTSGGSCHDAEMHMVHYNENNSTELLVVGTLMDASGYAENVELQKLWEVLVTGEEEWEEDVFSFSPYEMLPANPSYSCYVGSLTTPPCTEGVQWIVMSDATLISETQLDMFRHSMIPYHRTTLGGNTNRPTQPIHGREVYYVPG